MFSKLAAEEQDFLDDPEDVAKIPKFGNSTTLYEDVHEFYAYWMAFSTNKSKLVCCWDSDLLEIMKMLCLEYPTHGYLRPE